MHDITIDNNWFEGGGYVMYGPGAGSPNVRIINNVFSRKYYPKIFPRGNCGYFGINTGFDSRALGWLWSGNKDETGKIVPYIP
jgi:hypothetical protein